MRTSLLAHAVDPEDFDVQAAINRGEERARTVLKPAAAPLLAARQAERVPFADTVVQAAADDAALEPNDDDDAWYEPHQHSCVALVLSVSSALVVLCALGWGLHLMMKVG